MKKRPPYSSSVSSTGFFAVAAARRFPVMTAERELRPEAVAGVVAVVGAATEVFAPLRVETIVVADGCWVWVWVCCGCKEKKRRKERPSRQVNVATSARITSSLV